jgi:hypothetical protein
MRLAPQLLQKLPDAAALQAGQESGVALDIEEKRKRWASLESRVNSLESKIWNLVDPETFDSRP